MQTSQSLMGQIQHLIYLISIDNLFPLHRRSGLDWRVQLDENWQPICNLVSNIVFWRIHHLQMIYRARIRDDVLTYRRFYRWTKYSNPFYPVQPPGPLSSMMFNVNATWSALALMDETNQTPNITFGNTRAETLRFGGAGVQHSACCRVWIFCPSTVVEVDRQDVAPSATPSWCVASPASLLVRPVQSATQVSCVFTQAFVISISFLCHGT